MADKDSPSPRRARRRRRVWTWVGVASLVVVVWAALSGWQLWKAVQDARAGLDAVKVARTRESAIDVVKQSTLAPLALAQADFAAARSHLDFPLLVPI
ncbi:MAG: hypothetical protein ACRD1G_20400, partial [Acidimicrobiales bacterium]